MELTKEYYLLQFSGLPVITEHDSIKEAYDSIHAYISHWFIAETKTNKKIKWSDIPDGVTEKEWINDKEN